jgi:hypothetical protein
MPRSDAYLQSYSRSAAAAQRWEQITESVQAQDELAIELQKLISDEFDSISRLEETLRTKASPFDTAAKILNDRVAATAAASAAASAAATLPPSLATLRTSDSFGTAMVGLKSLSAAQQGLVRKKAQELGVNPAVIEVFNKRIAAGVIQTTKPPAGKAPSGEEAQLVSILAQQGEQGFRGGTEGRAFREALDPAQSSALDEYLRILSDGRVPPPDHPGAAVYDEVAARGAYQNKDAKLFNSTWVALRQRITDLQSKAEAADPTKLREGRTPEQEVMYRELRARGIDPDDPYLDLRGTPAYEALTLVAKMPKSRDGLPLRGTGPAYASAQQYVEVARKSGQKPSVPALIDQLRKVTSSDQEAAQVAAWAIAWDTATRQPPAREAKEADKAAQSDAVERQKAVTSQLTEAEKQAKVEDLKARSQATAESMRKMLAERQAPAPAPAPAPRPETVAPLEALDAALAGRAPPPAPRATRPAPAPARPPSAQSPAPPPAPPPAPGRVDFSRVPAATVTAPAPAPSRTKVVRDPVTGEFVEVRE